jgi:hypothetical protein
MTLTGTSLPFLFDYDNLVVLFVCVCGWRNMDEARPMGTVCGYV